MYTYTLYPSPTLGNLTETKKNSTTDEGLLISNETGLQKFAEHCASAAGPKTFERLTTAILDAAGEDHTWLAMLVFPTVHIFRIVQMGPA